MMRTVMKPAWVSGMVKGKESGLKSTLGAYPLFWYLLAVESPRCWFPPLGAAGEITCPSVNVFRNSNSLLPHVFTEMSSTNPVLVYWSCVCEGPSDWKNQTFPQCTLPACPSASPQLSQRFGVFNQDLQVIQTPVKIAKHLLRWHVKRSRLAQVLFYLSLWRLDYLRGCLVF